ncbi:MAG: hypothetical protein OWT27_00070 [Firmicutes bacterium]|nr:hypothetical protein [Bacillota bacterium]
MKRWGIVVGAVVLLAAAAVGVREFGFGSGQSEAAAGPQLVLSALGGRSIRVNPADYTVLDFMSSSCADCLQTAATLRHFEHRKGIELISVDVAPQVDSAATIAAFERIAQTGWPYVLEKTPGLIDRFHVTELDTVVVLHDGRVVYHGISPSVSQLQQVLV